MKRLLKWGKYNIVWKNNIPEILCLVQKLQFIYLFLIVHLYLPRLVNLIKSQPQEERPGESLLAGAMAMGLCYISRVRYKLYHIYYILLQYISLHA